MERTKNQLITTMSTTRFNISDNCPTKHLNSQTKSQSLTPTGYLSDNTRSCAFNGKTSNFNLSELIRNPYLSLSQIKKQDISSSGSLHERLHNEAKEYIEKLKSKEKENLQKIKREAIPKIHKLSQQIERKQELFAERLYPYHKLSRLPNSNSESDSISFEYANVATVRSNPLGMSEEFDNDDFRNNIDSIFCDDEEIKNLYGNKPSFVKIYRGIKHHKKVKYAFKPTLSKNTFRILERMEKSQPQRKSNSMRVKGEKSEAEDNFVNRYSIEFCEDSQCERKSKINKASAYQEDENEIIHNKVNFNNRNNNNNNNHGSNYKERDKLIGNANTPQQDFLFIFDKRTSDSAIELQVKGQQVSNQIPGHSDNKWNENSVVINTKILNNNKINSLNDFETVNNKGIYFENNNRANASNNKIDVNTSCNLTGNLNIKINKINEVHDILNEEKGIVKLNNQKKNKKKTALDYFKNPKRDNSLMSKTAIQKQNTYSSNCSILSKVNNNSKEKKTQKFKKLTAYGYKCNLANSINFKPENKSTSKIVKNEINSSKQNTKNTAAFSNAIFASSKSKNKNRSSSFVTYNSLSTNYTKKHPEASAYLNTKKEENQSSTMNNSIKNYITNNNFKQKLFNEQVSSNISFLSNFTSNNSKFLKNNNNNSINNNNSGIFKAPGGECRSSSAKSNKSGFTQGKYNYDLSKYASNNNCFSNKKSPEINQINCKQLLSTKSKTNNYTQGQGQLQGGDFSYNSNLSGFSIYNKKGATAPGSNFKRKINRAGSMVDRKEKSIKNSIRINKAVYEIEDDNIQNEMIKGNNSNVNISHNIFNDKIPNASSQINNKNMNINFSVNFLMNE